MATSFETFQEKCLDEGITLNKDWLAEPSFSQIVTHRPDVWYGAVAGAGYQLREDPQAPLTDKPIPGHLIGPQPYLPQTTLLTMLNDSLLRPQTGDSGACFESPEAYGLNACMAAEEYFAATVEAMADPGTPIVVYGDPLGWSIIESEGQAVAVSKTYNNRSTLALVPFSVNNVRYPAGSLFAAGTPHTETMAGDERLVLPAGDVHEIGFLRLSAFALPPAERIQDFNMMITTAVSYTDTIRYTRLESIRAIAQKALQYATV